MMNSDVSWKVQQFAPILKFGKGETFFPMNVAPYVKACSLHRWHRFDRSAPYLMKGQVSLEELHTLEDSNLFLVYADHDSFFTQQDLAEQSAYSAMMFTSIAAKVEYIRQQIELGKIKLLRPVARVVSSLDQAVYKRALEIYGGPKVSEPTYYYRVLHKQDYGGPYDVIQYWYFYAYNDWATTHAGNNDHEADWETVQLFFNNLDDAHPVDVVFSAHHANTRMAWDAIEKVDDQPVVYVAPGSHANFPSSDDFNLLTKQTEVPWTVDDKLTIGYRNSPLTWNIAIDLSSEKWVDSFRGAWGGRYYLNTRFPCFEKPGGAPRGPRWTHGDKERPSWRNPVEWVEKSGHIDFIGIITGFFRSLADCIRRKLFGGR